MKLQSLFLVLTLIPILPDPHLRLKNYKVTELEQFLLLLAAQQLLKGENDTSSRLTRSADDESVLIKLSAA